MGINIELLTLLRRETRKWAGLILAISGGSRILKPLNQGDWTGANSSPRPRSRPLNLVRGSGERLSYPMSGAEPKSNLEHFSHKI